MYRHIAESIKETESKQFISQAEKDKYNGYVNTFRRKDDTYNKTELQSFVDEFNTTYLPIEGSNISIDGTKDSYINKVEILGNTIQDSNNLADIRSVGDKLEEGRYEIPIIVRGKNLFDGELEEGTYHIETGEKQHYPGESRSVNKIKCRPNCEYKLTSVLGVHVIVYMYDKNGKYLSYIGIGDNRPFITINGAEYLTFRYNANILDKDIQFEEGEISTLYEPYQEHKLSILSPVPLEKVGNVSDRIIEKDGIWGIEKNIGTIHITPEQVKTIQGASTIPNDCIGISVSNIIRGYNQYDKGISNTMRSVVGWEHKNTVFVNEYRHVSFVISKGLLDSADITGFNKWLIDKGEVYFKYVILTSEFIPLPDDQQVILKTFANKTNISFLCEIDGVIKGEVTKTVAGTVDSQVKALADLSEEIEKLETLGESVSSEIVTDDGFVTIEKTNNGYLEDFKLEGNTLVNAIKLNDVKQLHIAGNGIGVKTILNGGVCRWEKSNGELGATYYPKIHIDNIGSLPIQYNKQYTIMYTVKASHEIRKGFAIAYHDAYEGINEQNGNVVYSYISSGVRNNFTVITSFTTKTPSEIVENLYIGFGAIITNEPSWVEIRDFIIIEGDHTNKPLSYFEGLKSVGDNTDEIIVSSVKGDGNLCRFKKSKTETKNGITFSVDESTQELTLNGTCTVDNTSFGIAIDDISKSRLTGYYSVTIDKLTEIKSTKAYFRLVNPTYTRGFNVNLGSSESPKQTVYYNNDDYSCSIRVDANQTFSNAKFKVCIVEGETSSTFIDVKQDKKQVLFKNNEGKLEKPVLRALPNGVKDTIEKHSDGKYYYHKRCNEVVLNGSENWSKSFTNNNVSSFRTTIQNNKKHFGDAVTDRFNKLHGSSMNNTSIIEGFYNWDNYGFEIAVTKSKIATDDNVGFKSWLQTNNTTVVYELDKEEVYECTNLDLVTYDSETNLAISSGPIVPNVKAKVLNNIGSVVVLLRDKVSLIEKELYSQRMFESRVMLSSKYTADSVSLKSNIVIGASVPVTEYDMDLFSLMYEVILAGKDNYNRLEMEEMIDFYTMTDKISYEMCDELFMLIEEQQTVIEVLPEV